MANYDFTYGKEIGVGKYNSLIPHFPGGVSGATIGPGYDMGKRMPEQIKADMKAIGVNNETAERLSKGAGINSDGTEKKDYDPKKWVKDNKDIEITNEQQKTLYNKVLIPEYEQRVKKALQARAKTKSESEKKLYEWDNLNDEQKQILFDFEYNPGLSKFPNLMDGVVHKDRQKVLDNYKRYTTETVDGEKVKKELPRNKGFEKAYLKDPAYAAASAKKAGSATKAGNIAKTGIVSKAGNVPSAGTTLSTGGSASASSPAHNLLANPTPPVPPVPAIPEVPKIELPPIPEVPTLPGFSIAFPAARVMDYHLCPMIDPIFKPHLGGPIIGPGIPNVVIGGMIAATQGDMCTCIGPPDSIIKGSSSVLIGNKMAARFLDNCAHGGVIIQGCFTVLIGDKPSPTTVMGMLAAISGMSFIELCDKVVDQVKNMVSTSE